MLVWRFRKLPGNIWGQTHPLVLLPYVALTQNCFYVWFNDGLKPGIVHFNQKSIQHSRDLERGGNWFIQRGEKIAS